jgi:hypothetical protein
MPTVNRFGLIALCGHGATTGKKVAAGICNIGIHQLNDESRMQSQFYCVKVYSKV